MLQLIDFYADWCGPCQVMKPIIKEVEKDYEGQVEFKEIDVEAEESSARELDVQRIPTFMILKDGKEVSRKSGAMPKDVLKGWIDSNL
jgi:thioredoxin 1